MNVYVALIRAINVGGNSPVRMSDLRKRFESLGLQGVVTYIQSGNVVFSTEEKDKDRLSRTIEAGLSDLMGRGVKVFLLTPQKLEKAAAENPFDPARLDKEQRCHLMFLSASPSAARRRGLMAVQGEEYRFQIKRNVLYYAYSRKFDGNRRMIDFERILGVSGTSRSWRVVDKLIEISSRFSGRRSGAAGLI